MLFVRAEIYTESKGQGLGSLTSQTDGLPVLSYLYYMDYTDDRTKIKVLNNTNQLTFTDTTMDIPLNLPYITGKEFQYIEAAIENRHLAGNGYFTQKCEAWLEENVTCKKALLTHSCTAALEMAAILIDIKPGDEVILPSYTFVTTALAFVLRGGVPVFVDIRPDTLNIDDDKIEAAITLKTRAIVAVHYAGVACNMNKIMDLAKQYGLYVIEDAAQALLSSYKKKPLGSIGHLSTFSFHATKNIIAGEGGALCINDDLFLDRAEIIREKGTNRKQFFDGKQDKYTWLDIGSSYLPSEITAAFLYAQLEEASSITQKRLKLWESYQHAFEIFEQNKRLTRPFVPIDCLHNAHLYAIILPNPQSRPLVIQYCKEKGIQTTSHFLPLHGSTAGKKYCRAHGSLNITTLYSQKLLRLPLWLGIEDNQPYIIEKLTEAIEFSDQKLNCTTTT